MISGVSKYTQSDGGVVVGGLTVDFGETSELHGVPQSAASSLTPAQPLPPGAGGGSSQLR